MERTSVLVFGSFTGKLDEVIANGVGEGYNY